VLRSPSRKLSESGNTTTNTSSSSRNPTPTPLSLVVNGHESQPVSGGGSESPTSPSSSPSVEGGGEPKSLARQGSIEKLKKATQALTEGYDWR
jgi:hypothetical protein